MGNQSRVDSWYDHPNATVTTGHGLYASEGVRAGMDEYGVEMSETEVAEFLERQGHGVLSFGGDTPYGLPISFGYDVLENRCIFQLVLGDESKKRAYLDESDEVNLVAYDWQHVDDWQSVIIDGHVRPIPDDGSEAVDAARVFSELATAPSLTVFERPISELEPVWYELEIEAMTGRQAPNK